jgi:signal transduction histidine kinase
MRLAGTRGIGRAAHARLAAAAAIRPDPSPAQLQLAARSFEAISGTTHASAVRAGRAIILAGDAPTGYEEAVEMIAALLGATLDRLDREDRRAHDLDLGLAMTAHEIREPLLGARIALEHVVHGSDAKHLGLLRQTEKELAGLSAKIDALLRWSVGSTPLRIVRTDLAQVARDAVKFSIRVHGNGPVSLRAPLHIPVRADPIQLGSAIENVVRNAMAYAPSSSPIDVRVYETKMGRPTVTVRDRGPGIPPDERAMIFDPLSRGRSSGLRQGNGLGLFVAKKVMDAHGGDISFRSASDGIGTVFRLRLPQRFGGSG